MDVWVCAKTTCESTIKRNHWATKHGQTAGWFFQKNPPIAWCPEHTPDWVSAWRQKQILLKGEL